MKGNPHRAAFVGGHFSGGISYLDATGVCVFLSPYTDAGRAACFGALTAADRRDFQPLVDIWRDRLAHAETPEA